MTYHEQIKEIAQWLDSGGERQAIAHAVRTARAFPDIKPSKISGDVVEEMRIVERERIG